MRRITMSTSQRGVVFLDSSIIIRYFIGDISAKEVLEGHSKFAINSIVYSEVAFNLLKLLYVDKYGGYRFYDMKSALSGRDTDLLKGYRILYSFIDELLSEEKLAFLPITLDVIEEATRIAAEYGLLPNDSLIVATCKHYGINTIATFDEVFKRIPWIRVIP